MNKHILKLLIVTLVLLMGLGAVNAFDCNSSDEIMSFEQNDIISVNNNDSEVLSIENNDNETIALNNNANEVLSIENNNETIALSNNTGEVLSIENNDNNVLSVDINESKLSSGSVGIFYENNGKIKVTEEYKTFYIGKLTIPYNKKYENGDIPSKKNKKAWKKYKNYLKSQKKAINKFEKQAKKQIKKIKKAMKKGHWKYPSESHKIKKYKNKWVATYYISCMRQYRYNLETKQGWW